MADKLKHVDVTVKQVASENETYKPAKSGLFLFGNNGAGPTSFALVFLSSSKTYSVTASGLGISGDPAPGIPKYLYSMVGGRGNSHITPRALWRRCAA